MNHRQEELWYLELPRKNMVELIWILEGYEGVAVPRVLSREQGLVELVVAPDFKDLLEWILEDLGKSFPVKRVQQPQAPDSIAFSD
ncbi:MAG: DUF4911 domain-containing protein [bacterium]